MLGRPSPRTINSPRELSYESQVLTEAQRRFFANATRNELLLRPIGSTVYLMPPYILDDEEIGGLAARTQTVFEQTLAEAP